MATLSRFKAAHRLSAAPGVPSRRSRSGTAALEELVLPVFELPLLVLLVLGAPCTADGVTRAALDWRAHTASSSTAALHMRMPTALPVSRRRPATARPPDDQRRSSAQATSPEITPSLQESGGRTLQSKDTPSLPPTSLLLPPVTHQHVSASPCPRLAFVVMIQKFCSVAQQLTTR